jgi:hypothetical protein
MSIHIKSRDEYNMKRKLASGSGSLSKSKETKGKWGLLTPSLPDDLVVD